MSTIYDHDVAPKNDFFVDLAETALSGLKYTILPGSILANELPILRFIPTWLPGAGFKRIALEVRKSVLQMRDVPFASVETKIVCDLSYHFLSPTHNSHFIERRQGSQLHRRRTSRKLQVKGRICSYYGCYRNKLRWYVLISFLCSKSISHPFVAY